MGMAKPEPWSSEMTDVADNDAALDGSSNVTVCLLPADSVRLLMVALFSFLPPDKTLTPGTWSC
jgi:hypothetical protein